MLRKKTVFAVALGLVGAAAIVLVATHIVVGSVSDKVHTDLAEIAPRAVIVVPGAGLLSDGTPHGFLRERLECARAAFSAGKAPFVLVSGDHGAVGYDEPTAMKTWLADHGVPADRITRDFAGFRTRDTMERAAKVFGARSAIICTQGLHANRSLFLAKDAGLDAVVMVARGDAWFGVGQKVRERIATVAAAFDVLLGTEPRFLGPGLQLGVAP